MKVTKEVIQSKDKQNRLKEMFSKKEEKTPSYDGTVKYMLSKYEYEFISDLDRRIKYQNGYKRFVLESVNNHNENSNLILPVVEDQSLFHLLTLTFEKEQKEQLKQAAKDAKLSLEEYVRAVVWTNYKQLETKHNEREKRIKENLRKSQGTFVSFNLYGPLLEKYEGRFGTVTTQEEATKNIVSFLNKSF